MSTPDTTPPTPQAGLAETTPATPKPAQPETPPATPAPTQVAAPETPPATPAPKRVAASETPPVTPTVAAAVAPAAAEPKRQGALGLWVAVIVLAACVVWLAIAELNRDASPNLALASLGARVASIEARPAADPRSALTAVAALEPRIAAIERAQTELGARLAGLGDRPAQAPVDDQARAGLAALGGRIAAIEGQTPPPPVDAPARAGVAAVERRIAAIEGQVPPPPVDAQARAGIAAAEQRIAAIEARPAPIDPLPLVAAAEARLAARAVLSELLDQGQPLSAGLARLPPASAAPPALTRFADRAPPTLAGLAARLPAAGRAARDVIEGALMPEGALARLSGMVTIRRGDQVVVGAGPPLPLAEAQRKLDGGDLNGALADLATLPPAGADAPLMRAWLEDARALAAARAALATLSITG